MYVYLSVRVFEKRVKVNKRAADMGATFLTNHKANGLGVERCKRSCVQQPIITTRTKVSLGGDKHTTSPQYCDMVYHSVVPAQVLEQRCFHFYLYPP